MKAFYDECFVTQFLWHTGAYKENAQKPSYGALAIWLNEGSVKLDAIDISARLLVYDYVVPFGGPAVTFLVQNTPSRSIEVAKGIRDLLEPDPRFMKEEERDEFAPKILDMLRKVQEENVPVRFIKPKLIEWGFLKAKSGGPVGIKHNTARTFTDRVLDAIRTAPDGMIDGLFVGRLQKLSPRNELYMAKVFKALEYGNLTRDLAFKEAVALLAAQHVTLHQRDTIKREVDEDLDRRHQDAA